MAAGENEVPHLGVTVHLDLNPGQQLRKTLDLVKDDRAGMRLQKGLWVLTRQAALLGIFEVNVVVLRKSQARQGGLAGLPGTHEGDDRILAGQALGV